jgi:signal peptidase
MVAVQQISMVKLYPGKFRRESLQGLTSWVAVGMASVLFLWFSLGVFPVRPTVIISGSMRPGIEIGDIVLVGKINPKLLKTGDIIQFRQKDSSIPVVHRIIEVVPADDKYVYTTKGDANSQPDSEPVLSEQVVGRVITIVPKVGWAGMTVRNLLN